MDHHHSSSSGSGSEGRNLELMVESIYGNMDRKKMSEMQNYVHITIGKPGRGNNNVREMLNRLIQMGAPSVRYSCVYNMRAIQFLERRTTTSSSSSNMPRSGCI